MICCSGQIVAWTGLIRVDGKTFTWLGRPDVGSELATQTAYEYTASKSIFTIDVDGKVEIKASFISPLAPEDFKRQSLIASYLNVEVASIDGADHSVQLYTDISAGTLSQGIRVPGFVQDAALISATYRRLYGIWYLVWYSCSTQILIWHRMGLGERQCCSTLGL